ncbi:MULTISPECIES: hemolysin family protein [Kordiimonas]|uniref:CBS domain-containing protein n=1 Tax=Kordiimonas lacus TaxID=637679 RepID=A0A1G7EA94_9PROT|nr:MULTISPECIES: hemolysin family protein [Kordiimonas]SDE60588.1 CBS domain-containing protein [Kordiimonas lacus]
MTDQSANTPSGDSSSASSKGQGGFWRSLKDLLGFRNGEVSLRESLEEAIEEHEEETRGQSLGDEEREMLFNVLRYGALRVDDVMVPRADIVGVPSDIGYSGLIKVFADANHSRMPVYRETLDTVLGMVHVKDALRVAAEGAELEEFKLSTIQRPVLFVPPSMKVIDLLAKMRLSRTHMAIVVDEYGGTDGLLTVEDIVEEIFGEIEDEHDEIEDPYITPLENGGYDVDARLEVDELEEIIGVDLLPEELDEGVDTVGGLVFSLAGCVPEIGEVMVHESGYRFEVVDADPRRIHKVRIHVGAEDSTLTAED